MRLQLNKRYMTQFGGVELKRDGNYLVILSKHTPCRLRMDKVHKLGLLNYLQHVGTVQVRNHGTRMRWKYNNLQLIIGRIQQGLCTATEISTTTRH